MAKGKKNEEISGESPTIKNISFPSHMSVTYSKMKETVLKFVELGGGPFTKKQIEDKMSKLGSIGEVIKRVVPFLTYLGFMKRSRVGKTGVFTYTLIPDIRKKLESNPEEFDPIFIKLCKNSPAYRAIWRFAEEIKSSKFLVSAFKQQYLQKLGLSYSSRGLSSWLNALKKVNLIDLDGDFISLEGVSSPFEVPRKEVIGEKPSKAISTMAGLPPSGEGIAPGMTFNVNVNLDYRQPPDLQREYMQWLERMSSKPNVMVSIEHREEKSKETKSEKKTG